MAASSNQEIFRGLCRYAREHAHWSLIPIDLREDRDCAALKRAGIDGLILQVLDRRLMKWAKSFRVPTVSVSQFSPDPSIPIVSSDDALTGRTAAEYFLARGYRNFAFYGREGHPTSEQRQRGYVERLTQAGFGCKVLTTRFSYRARQQGESFMCEIAPWLDGLPRPAALFGWSDQACGPLLNLCGQLDIAVPSGIAVLGAGNDPLHESSSQIDLSSVVLGTHAIGYEAGRSLAGLFNKSRRCVPITLVPPVRIISRQSTDWIAVGDSRIQRVSNYIRQNAGGPIYVEELAKAAGLSRRPLEKLFQRVLGASPLVVINRLRVERAKELLLSGNLKLELISSLCGFADARRFSVTFKNVAGEAPSAYRRRNLVGD